MWRGGASGELLVKRDEGGSRCPAPAALDVRPVLPACLADEEMLWDFPY